jgi:hypothetical protein
MLGWRAARGSSSSITVYPRAAPTPQHGVPAGSYPRPEQAERRPGAHVLPAVVPARKAANLTTVRLAGQEGAPDAHQ